MKADIMTIGMVCRVQIDLGITLWQAIKLRIAGKAYLPIAEKIGRELIKTMKDKAKSKMEQHIVIDPSTTNIDV